MFRVGDWFIYYNKWTGWEPEDLPKRKPVYPKDMKVGDKLWLDVDPIHHHGKVYGYVLVEIKEIKDDKVFYTGGWICYSDKWGTKFSKFLNEKKAFAFWEKHPLAKGTGYLTSCCYSGNIDLLE